MSPDSEGSCAPVSGEDRSLRQGAGRPQPRGVQEAGENGPGPDCRQPHQDLPSISREGEDFMAMVWEEREANSMGPQRSEKCKQFVQSAHIHTQK